MSQADGEVEQCPRLYVSELGRKRRPPTGQGEMNEMWKVEEKQTVENRKLTVPEQTPKALSIMVLRTGAETQSPRVKAQTVPAQRQGRS